MLARMPGMVASSQRAATEAGCAILAGGGNAADAAIAVAAALAVTEPNSTGLGGDAFALYYEGHTGRITSLNGSGRAPAGLTLGRLERAGVREAILPFSGDAITVPGACAAWIDLAERHGSMAMDGVLAPAIELAQDGFEVGAVTAHFWARGLDGLLRAPGGAEMTIDGRAPIAGERFRNPGLAGVLASIAEGGKGAFYGGAIARDIVDAARAAGSAMTLADLERHHSTWHEPIGAEYRGHRIWECPPNGQGMAALLALQILRGFEIADTDPMGTERLHLITEALRLAFADARRHVADPAVYAPPTGALLSESYASARRAQIDPARRIPVAAGEPPERAGTVQFCVVDASGNACSFVNSNYMGFGTCAVPPGRGFTLQNRGCNFSLEPGHPNVVAPHKRPYHTIIPGLITRADGSLYGPFGVMGGFMQPQGHVQVVLAMLDDGLEPQAALDRPRLCIEPGADGDHGELLCEEGIPEPAARGLERLGHPVRSGVGGFERAVFGRGQIIRRDESGDLLGGSDFRADGCAAGV